MANLPRTFLVSAGGFFTQLHRVTCVGEAVRAVVLQLDDASLNWITSHEAPRLSSCLAECIGTVDAACEGGRPLRSSEMELFEPALDYHTHGGAPESSPPPH